MGTASDPAERIDGARIAARLDALWDVAQAPGGGADRPAWSPAEAAAMRLVAGWAAEAGLEPRLDAHGNLWALPPGDGPVATSGSHVDTVPAGGRHDGAHGTGLALDAAAALDGRVGVLTCAAEEAPRFAAGTLGSRLLTGALAEAALEDMRDAAGTTAAEARAAFLRELDDLPRLPGPTPLARLRAHAEVHIEPRHELRAAGAQLGVVERIAAPHRHELTVTGEAGHAGEVAMASASMPRTSSAATARAGMTLTAPGSTASEPTVATVAGQRTAASRAAASSARTTSAAAARASWRSAIATSPAWPASPVTVSS